MSRVERVYDRVAPVYDWYEAPMDRMGGHRRRIRLTEGAHGDVLEVGVGTGRNLSLYPEGVRVTGIDISARMLDHARERAAGLSRRVWLLQADVEALPYEAGAFDIVTASCVFCSVSDPVRGLQEVRRVVRADGELRLLEHVRPRNAVLGKLFDWLSPVTRRLFGPEINRRTEENVRTAGFEIETVRRHGIWREIVARPFGVETPDEPT